MASASNSYHLRVTAGSSYDSTAQQLVHVNTSQPVHIKTSSIDAHVTVRINNYRGLPTDSPTTCAYFQNPPHEHDLYSISFRFSLPNKDGQEINGNDLLFGNDFANPIRDHLPPGFSTALRIVKWTVDPGIDGDAYADHPYLYGPLLSSINTLCIREAPQEGSTETTHDTQAWKEGGFGRGEELRKKHHVPGDVGGRRKHFLTEQNRKDWSFTSEEAQGLEYECDFFNPYLDFNEFSLKLPGFTLPIMKYWDGQALRYVLKHKTKDGSVDEPLFVIVFTLVKDEDLEEDKKKWESKDTGTKKEDGQQSDYVDEDID